jgi:predicted enzyme related to lactoylglutathione lyase
MINYRVKNMDTLINQLQREGVTIIDKVEVVEYGKFVHIMDPEGNKIELWESNDVVYEKLGKELNIQTVK